MDKMSGGLVLQCGHRQVVSSYRLDIAKTGSDQHKVWCVECNDWTQLLPIQGDPEATSQEESLG